MSRLILSVGKTGSLNQYLDHLFWMAKNGRGGPYLGGMGFSFYYDNQVKIIKSIDVGEDKFKGNEIFGSTFLGYCGSIEELGDKRKLVNVLPLTREMLSFVSDSKFNDSREFAPYVIFKFLMKGFAPAIVNLRQMNYDSLNFIITDGRFAAVYRETRSNWAVHSLFYQLEEDRFTVASDELHGKWYEVEDRTLLFYRDGRLKEYPVREEVPHVPLL